jgi:hypothetical protein
MKKFFRKTSGCAANIEDYGFCVVEKLIPLPQAVYLFFYILANLKKQLKNNCFIQISQS